MRTAGSTVLLTGAAGGIGATLARRLAATGATLVVTGRREETLKPLADELGSRLVVADLADPRQVARLAEESGDVDVLVAGAALPASGDLFDYTPEQVERALAVNLHAPIMLARLLAPRMVTAGRGHLVFVGSMSGKAATRFSTLYTATKHGLRGFSHALRQDLHGTGVGVSLIQPGFVGNAGMFAATGIATPSGLRTVTSDQVATAVIRAIEDGHGEINVAPVKLRLLCALAAQFPGLYERIQRRDGGEDLAERIVDAQRASR